MNPDSRPGLPNWSLCLGGIVVSWVLCLACAWVADNTAGMLGFVFRSTCRCFGVFATILSFTLFTVFVMPKDK